MGESLDIISNVIPLQYLLYGVFSIGGLIFALLLLFGKPPCARGKLGDLCKESWQALTVGGILILFPIYFLGVTTQYLAGRWIDKPSWCWHLGLKDLWNQYDEDDRTDDGIKCAMYSRAFGCDKNLCKYESNIETVREWYLQVYSHIILEKKNEEFREYILYAQRRANLARLWAFVSFVILVTCLPRGIFLLGRAGWHRRHKLESSVKSELCTVLIIAGVAVMIYGVSVNVWVQGERGTSARVWRFAKSFPERATAWEVRDKKNKCLPPPLEIKIAHPKRLSPET